MKRAIVSILIITFMILSMSACDDARELNTWVYTYAIGVDKGVSDKLRFTIVVPGLKGELQKSDSGSSGKRPENADTTVISIDCPTIYSGLNLMSSFFSRRINYSHARMFIIGEEMAKEGIESFMQGMRITRQIRLSMHVIVVKGEAKDFIEAFSPATGSSIPRTMEGLLAASDETGFINNQTYLEVLQDLKSTKAHASCILAAVNDNDNLLPAGSVAKKQSVPDIMPGELAREGGNPVELIGAAVFRGDKLVGELNLGETRSLMMIKGDYLHGGFTIPDPLVEGAFVTVEANKLKEPQIKVSVKGDVPAIDVKVFYEGAIQNLQSDIRYQTEELKPVLEKAYADFIADSISKTIKKCQDLGCDIFGFGNAASMNFWTIQEWENYGWFEKYKNAQVNIEASMFIRRTGVIIENNPLQGE